MIAVAPGANARLTPGDILVAAEAMQGADVVLLQLETPVETVTRAVEVARAAGAKVMLNPAPALQGGIPPTLISKVDYLVPNENELALLAGADGEAPKDLAEAAMDMLHLGCRCVLVTRGREGATLVASGRALQMPAPEVDAVDAVAAGDTFCGAFACAIGEGMKEVDAMRFAVAAASLSVTRKGAQASMPRREEIDAALAHV
jgi:ribokinase